MALVDYSSTSDSSDNESVPAGDTSTVSSATGPPPAKRRRPDELNANAATAAGVGRGTVGVDGPSSSSSGNGSTWSTHAKEKQPASDLPPLPGAFHDLYASSVRQSVSDDPTLHHGRKRAIPHVAGNWPSHIYIEWHPTAQQHATLVGLLAAIQHHFGDSNTLNSLLTSDLNAPLPLHISLSRPLALTTTNKDAFLDELTTSLRGFQPPVTTAPVVRRGGRSTSTNPTSHSPSQSQFHPHQSHPSLAASPFSNTTDTPGPSSDSRTSFTVSPSDLAFYKGPDSDRTFLILRVTHAVASKPHPVAGSSSNPQLRELLRRCNVVAAAHGLPTLYAPNANAPQEKGQSRSQREGKSQESSSSRQGQRRSQRQRQQRLGSGSSQSQGRQQHLVDGNASDAGNTSDGSNAKAEAAAALVDNAFHVSIAWTFGPPPEEEKCLKTYETLRTGRFREIQEWKVPVGGVKAKIGNVVTHIPLAEGR